MGKAVVNYLKGMVAAASDPQCVKVVERAPAPTASTVDNEDELVIDVGEEDLFLSEGEYRVVSRRKLFIK